MRDRRIDGDDEIEIADVRRGIGKVPDRCGQIAHREGRRQGHHRPDGRHQDQVSQPIGVAQGDPSADPRFIFTGAPKTFSNDPGELSRWKVQLGLRYFFN